MLHFAYDGSLNGDWVAHYGIRLAAHHPERALFGVDWLRKRLSFAGPGAGGAARLAWHRGTP